MLVENYSNSPPVWTVFIPGIFPRASGPTNHDLRHPVMLASYESFHMILMSGAVCEIRYYTMSFKTPQQNKLTWLALAEDHAALSRSLEQLMALPRSVKVKRVLLVSLAAKFVAEAAGVRAAANG